MNSIRGVFTGRLNDVKCTWQVRRLRQGMRISYKRFGFRSHQIEWTMMFSDQQLLPFSTSFVIVEFHSELYNKLLRLLTIFYVHINALHSIDLRF